MLAAAAGGSLFGPVSQPARHTADDASRLERQLSQVERNGHQDVFVASRPQQASAEAGQQAMLKKDADGFRVGEG